MQDQFERRCTGDAPVKAVSDWRYASSCPGIVAGASHAVSEYLTAGHPTNSQHIQEFEAQFAALHGVTHAIAVENGTAGLHLALLAAGIGDSADDEVIQPSLNTAEAANMTVAAGARPVFADIVSPIQPTLDPGAAAELVRPNTKAILAMHYGGYPAGMIALENLCRSNDLLMIEQSDYRSGYALPKLANRALGAERHIGCYSLGKAGPAPWDNGGMLVTNDDALAAQIRSLLWRSSNALTSERDAGRTGTSEIMAHGFRYRMNSLRAAIGLDQLEQLPAAHGVCKRRAQAYANVVETFCGETVEYVYGWAPQGGSAQAAAILVDPDKRNGLRAFLTEQRVQTRLHAPPLHTLNAFARCHSGPLRHTEMFADSVVMLPIHHDLPAKAPEHIIRMCMTWLSDEGTIRPRSASGHLRVA